VRPSGLSPQRRLTSSRLASLALYQHTDLSTTAVHLLPREEAKILVHNVGSIAQKRLARGLRLNLSEATALIACVLQELIRDGKSSVAELMSIGESLAPYRWDVSFYTSVGRGGRSYRSGFRHGEASYPTRTSLPGAVGFELQLSESRGVVPREAVPAFSASLSFGDFDHLASSLCHSTPLPYHY
jgi:urease gamma subunit